MNSCIVKLRKGVFYREENFMEYKLFFAGDVVISNSTELSDVLDDNICTLIKKHDIACCNFEAPIIHMNASKINKIGPCLMQNEHSAEIVEEAGFNIVSLANNHIMDYGAKGLKATITAFNKCVTVGASCAPSDVYKPYITDLNGKKFAFIMIAENGFGCADDFSKNGFAWMMDVRVLKMIRKIRNEVDYVILNCHAGAEHWEQPLPELRTLYKSWIDNGADIIIGHHPHIVQGWEKYENGYIFYSLGNFCFEPEVGINYQNTIAVSITISKGIICPEILFFHRNDSGKLLLGESNDFSNCYKGQVELLNDCTGYPEYIEIKSKNVFESIYVGYYKRVLGMYEGGFMGILKSFIRRYIFREIFSEKWLYHNLSIETHYWITRRAVSRYSHMGSEENTNNE